MSETRLYHIAREYQRTSKETFVYKYVKRFVYVHITGLGYISEKKRCGMSNKTVYEYVERFVYVHVTELGCVTRNNVV